MWLWFVWEFWPFYGSDGFGITALTYKEIAAWSDLREIKPTPFEVTLLMRLDVLFRSAMTKKPQRPSAKSGDTHVDASNSKAIGALMQNFRVRAKEVFGKKAKDEPDRGSVNRR